MEAQFPIFHGDMIHRAGSAPHTALDFRPLEGRAGGGGAGDSPILVAQHHFAVGADVDHQGQIIQGVQPGSQQAAHGVRPHEARDVGKNPHRAPGVDGKKSRRGQGQPLGNIGHIGRHRQGLGVDFQQQVVHGGVAHDAGGGDVRRGDPCLFRRRLCQFRKSLPDTAGQLFGVAFHGVLDSGDHVRTELGLGVHAAGFAQQGPGDAVHQVGHHGGGAQIEGDAEAIGPVGRHVSGLGIGENPGAVLMGKRQNHIPVNHRLAGQLFGPVYDHLTFSAFAPAAAGGVRV